MGWTGSAPNKTFVRTDGVYSGATVYAQEKAAAIGIVETNLDATEYDMAQGINSSLQKNGDNKMTGVIDAGGYGFSDLAVLGSATEASLASSTTTDLLGSSALFNVISGTTTITSLGTGASRLKVARFSGILTLTHNATSLILPGGANITTAAGDTMFVVSDATSNARVVAYQPAATAPGDATLAALAAYNTNGLLTQTAADTFTGRTITAGAGISVSNGSGVSGNPTIAADIGKQSIWVPSAAMTARSTNGASRNTLEMTTNKNMFVTMDYDPSTQQFAQFSIQMPKSWNEGTITFVPVWSHAAAVTNFGIVWALQAVAVHDNGAGDVAFGTEQTSTDTGGTTNNIYQGPESSAITVAGSPAAGDYVMFQIKRNPSDGSDTLAVNGRLHGIKVLYTIDVLKDD